MAAESDKKTVADRVTARKADWPEVLKTRHLRIVFPSEHSMRATQKKSWHRILTGAYVPGRVQNWLPEVKEAPAWEEQNAKEVWTEKEEGRGTADDPLADYYLRQFAKSISMQGSHLPLMFGSARPDGQFNPARAQLSGPWLSFYRNPRKYLSLGTPAYPCSRHDADLAAPRFVPSKIVCMPKIQQHRPVLTFSWLRWRTSAARTGRPAGIRTCDAVHLHLVDCSVRKHPGPFIDKYCQPTTEIQYLGEPNHGLDLGVEHHHFLLEMQAWDPANPREDPRAYTYSVNVAGGDDASQAVHLPDLILSLAKSGAGSRLDEMRPVLVVCQCILSRLSTKEGREVSDLLQRMVFRLARMPYAKVLDMDLCYAKGITLLAPDSWADFKGKYLDTLDANHLDDARHDIDFHTNMTAAAAADHRTHFSIRSNATYQTAITARRELEEGKLKCAPLETKNPFKGRPFAKYVWTKWGFREPKNFKPNKAPEAPPVHKQITQLERKKLEDMIALLKEEEKIIKKVKEWDKAIADNVPACLLVDG